eukprot:213719-Prymnesium_polylepis.1
MTRERAPVCRLRWKRSSIAWRWRNVRRAIRRSAPSVTCTKSAFRSCVIASDAARVTPYSSISAVGVSAASAKVPPAAPPAAEASSPSRSTVALKRNGTWIASSLAPIMHSSAAPTRSRSVGSASSHRKRQERCSALLTSPDSPPRATRYADARESSGDTGDADACDACDAFCVNVARPRCTPRDAHAQLQPSAGAVGQHVRRVVPASGTRSELRSSMAGAGCRHHSAPLRTQEPATWLFFDIHVRDF